MKLIFCKRCAHVTSIRSTPTTCHCGASGGRYTGEDPENNRAIYWGEAVPLGMNNANLQDAVRCGDSQIVIAWVFGPVYQSFKKVVKP